MDSYSNLETALNENRLVFAHGPSIDITALRILSVAQSLTNEVVFMVYKTNNLARQAYEIEVGMGENMNIGLAVGDIPIHMPPLHDIYSDRIIYCTSGKLRNILLEQIRRESIRRIGWIVIQSWDEYDANAYVVANLARKYTNASVTLLSCSEWAPLPYSDSISVACPHSGHKIEYTSKSIANLAPEITQESIYYGPEVGMAPLRAKGTKHSSKTRYDITFLTRIIIDTLKDNKGRPISKHLSDIRADTIREGTIYRIGTEAQFNALKARDPLKIDSSLDEAILHLKHANIDPLEILGATHPQEKIKEVIDLLSGTKTEGLDLDKVMSLRLGITSGIFYVSWTGKYGVKKERDRYIPGLISCLIEYPPSHYAPIQSYTPFMGRNDIETLCNVWSSIILSRSGPFWAWKSDRPVSSWCTYNGFDYASISRLMINMKRVCLGMKGELSLLDKIKTRELNMATEVFRDLEKTGAGPIKWNRSQILPTRHVTSIGSLLPVLHKGKMLEIYIDKNYVIPKSTIRAEKLDLFFGM